jgi:hypothetical protein
MAGGESRRGDKFLSVFWCFRATPISVKINQRFSSLFSRNALNINELSRKGIHSTCSKTRWVSEHVPRFLRLKPCETAFLKRKLF